MPSMEAYEQNLYEREVYKKLRKAEIESAASPGRYSHEDVMSAARKCLLNIENA